MSDRRGYSELANGDDVHCFCLTSALRVHFWPSSPLLFADVLLVRSTLGVVAHMPPIRNAPADLAPGGTLYKCSRISTS